jgi:hypothetical protein
MPERINICCIMRLEQGTQPLDQCEVKLTCSQNYAPITNDTCILLSLFILRHCRWAEASTVKFLKVGKFQQRKKLSSSVSNQSGNVKSSVRSKSCRISGEGPTSFNFWIPLEIPVPKHLGMSHRMQPFLSSQRASKSTFGH